MRTVWKYTITEGRNTIILLPVGAQILSLQKQNGVPQLWALVDPDNNREERTLLLVGTGQPIDEQNLRFIDTFQLEEYDLVFHLFEVLRS